MSDSRWELDHNGNLVQKETELSSNLNALIEQLFSQNSWTYTENEKNGPYRNITISNASNNEYNLNVFSGNIRNELRSQYEKKIQLNSKDPREKSIDNTIIIGVYVFNEDDQLEDAIIVGYPIDNSIRYNTNPSLRGVFVDKILQQAKLKGFVVDTSKNLVAFRPEFIFYYLDNYKQIHYNITEEPRLSDQEENQDEHVDRIVGGTNTLLYGVPGSGKSYTIETNYCNDFSLMERVVFHPDYMNTDFVGQILPTVKGEGDEKEITYDFTPGPFTRVMKKAINDPGEHYYLVIEEINRGNAPAIFGEIFQLLDRESDGTSSYKITNYNIASEVFGKKETPIFIPSNLSILATMNTADQNVFTLDTAFQRRWNMKMIENDVTKADHAKKNILDTTVTWEKFNTVINEQIITSGAATLSSEDKRLGSYFVTGDVLKYFSLEIDKNEIAEKYNINLDNAQKLETVIKDLNSRFGDKVIKYLWDDVFKFSRDDLFEPNYKSLEKVLYDFNRFDGDRRFDVFKQDIIDNLFSDNNIEDTRDE